MISHERFGKLRLAQFVPKAELSALSDWRFMDRTWLGEALGFSEWLRLQSDPDVLRSLSIDFSEFPTAAADSVLEALELPIRPGMSAAELRAVLGSPVGELRFVSDRVTYEFEHAGPPQFNVSCTVLHRGGLSYLVVMAPINRPGA